MAHLNKIGTQFNLCIVGMFASLTIRSNLIIFKRDPSETNLLPANPADVNNYVRSCLEFLVLFLVGTYLNRVQQRK